MGKITVKHYLNTNTKPLVVKGEDYYSIKLLVTVNRYTTRLTSVEFGELYTQQMFDEIEKGEDFQYMEKEETTIKNIVTAQLELNNNEFDSLLFNVLCKTMFTATLTESKELFRIISDRYKLKHIVSNHYSGGCSFLGLDYFSFWDFYNPSTQEKITSALIDNGFDKSEILKINKAAICLHFEQTISVLAKNVHKYKPLTKYKYNSNTAYNIVRYRYIELESDWIYGDYSHRVYAVSNEEKTEKNLRLEKEYKERLKALELWQNSNKDNDSFADYLEDKDLDF